MHQAVALTTLIGAFAVGLAWVPILVRFLRSWRARGNPISLAICVLVAFALYTPCYLAASFSPSWPLATVIVVDAVTCTAFYGAIAYASRKFPDVRKTGA